MHKTTKFWINATHNNMKKLLFVAFALCTFLQGRAQQLPVPSDEMQKVRNEFQDRKFGIFLHWGIYSMLGDGEWVMFNKRLGRQEYAYLAGGFCPSWFSAREWALLFKEAGAQYVTFTTRHHDGFSMWDTQASDYNIVKATPFGRDVVKELSQALAMEGIKMHFYYSHMDWYREDYPLGGTSKHLPHPDSTTNWAQYKAFMNQQLTELLTNYGPVGAIWFDGMWDHPAGSGFDWELKEQYDLIHRLQPKCMIGNNHHGQIVEGEDFQLFEQDLPGENTAGFSAKQAVSQQLPLESCQTMNNTWGYSITDKAYKSSDEIIRRLVKAAGMNSNLLLNIGPRPDGQLPDEAVKILQDMGHFMRTYGKSIYSTRGGVIPPQPWGVTTQKGKTLYIHILNTEEDGRIHNKGIDMVDGKPSILLPKGKYSISEVSLFTTGTRLAMRNEPDGTRIILPKRPTTDIVDYLLEAKLN